MVANWQELPAFSNNNTRICVVAAIFHYVNKCSWTFSMWRALHLSVEDQMHVINTHPNFPY